jgi:uncharacterized damage-inducible protein DinB
MNPYAAFLGERDPRVVIAETPARLAMLIAPLSDEVLQAPTAPGKWSVCQILCHLADTEMVFAFRWRQALAEPHHVIQPFDQDLWAEYYTAYSAKEALEMFSAARAWNLKLIASLPDGAMTKVVTHPERGTMTLGTVLETMGGHDLNHLGQVEAFASRAPAQ